ncbi:MAG: Uma2 family endonuclease [Bacteroidetes bacterium]|nr:Uma2 family endonuclease [Bacteroidota bacterium]
MISKIQSPPRTIMEVYKMLPEGTLAELIDGQIYMSPAPTNKHQRMLILFVRKLGEFVEKNSLGTILIAPSDVYFDDSLNAVQPDLYFVSIYNPCQHQDEVPYHGAPDLIAEFLSSSNNKQDLVTKKELYERFGVKEYWAIDPSTKEALVYQLKNKSYSLAGKETSRIYSPLFDHTFEF